MYEELKNLAEVKRFGMAIMFLSDKDRKGKNNHKTLKYEKNDTYALLLLVRSVVLGRLHMVLVKLVAFPFPQTVAQYC